MKHSLIVVALVVGIGVIGGLLVAGVPSGSIDDVVITSLPQLTDSPTPSSMTPSPAASPATTAAIAPTTTEPEPDILRRRLVDLVVVNATGEDRFANRVARNLRQRHYRSAVVVGAATTEESAVFAPPGLQREAARLAEDLGWSAGDVRPATALPDVEGELPFDLAVVLGQDQLQEDE